MNKEIKGDHQVWNNLWKGHSDKNILNVKYTETAPTSFYEFWQQAYARDLLNLIEGKRYTKFCELGCGTATTSMYLSKNGYEDITLVDLAEQAFEIASYSFNHYKLKQPKYFLENVENTSLPSESFDCIYNIGLLEHFEDPSKVMKESFRLMKKGGMVFMPIVPMMPVKKEILQIMIFNPIRFLKVLGFLAKGKKRKSHGMVRTEHGADFYSKIANDAGFKNVKCIAYNPYPLVNLAGSTGEKIQFWFNYLYYRLFKKGKRVTMKTSHLFNICILLTATK